MPAQPLQFAVLRHADISEPHFDLLFETLPGSQLATWRSPVWPIEASTPLTRLRDHRRLYLSYEGELSSGRGTVQRLVAGACEVEVGEGDVWTITVLSGAPPARLVFRKVEGENWIGEPA